MRNPLMSHWLYMDVKIIKTGKVGMVIDINYFDDSVLVEFPDGTREWYSESDISEIGL